MLSAEWSRNLDPACLTPFARVGSLLRAFPGARTLLLTAPDTDASRNEISYCVRPAQGPTIEFEFTINNP